MAIYNTKTGEKKYIGAVISERGTFRMDTSMDEVVIWDSEKQCTKMFHLAQGDWYVESGSDLNEKNKKEYCAYLNGLQEVREAQKKERMEKSLKRGEKVKVVKGRKVPIKTEGDVFFIRETQYGVTIGLLDASGDKHYTSLTNLERINGPDFNEGSDDYANAYVM